VIWGRWVDPNVKFTATDVKGILHEQFCYSADKEALRKRLFDKGFKDPVIIDYDFSEWKKRAAAAKDKAIWQRIKDRWTYFQLQARNRWAWLTDGDIAAIDGSKKELISKILGHDGCTQAEATEQVDAWSGGLAEEPPVAGQIVSKTAISFNDKIWKELKWHLFDLFHGKCAYCEHKPLAGYPGDVEHYRPKGKVDEDENHPGYYWLAYDEHNLLPACSLCNQPARAKLTHFPLKDGVHSRDLRSVAAEDPLLLNPYNQAVDPFAHLEFNEAGFSQPHKMSLYGETSRKIYDLDRPGLKEARFQAMQLVEGDWNTRIGRRSSIKNAYEELRAEIITGEREYAAALLWELDRVRSRTVQELMGVPGIGFPPPSFGG